LEGTNKEGLRTGQDRQVVSGRLQTVTIPFIVERCAFEQILQAVENFESLGNSEKLRKR
jgi:hypothetical protein